MLGSWPVRARLAAGFAAGLSVVLVLAGAFVYLQVGDDLNQALNTSLATRAEDVRALVEGSGADGIDLGGVRAGEEESTFAQVLSADGRVVDSTLPGGQSVLDPEQLAAAKAEPVRLDGLDLAGLEGKVRVIAVPAVGPDGSEVAVVGATTSDREEALAGIRRAFALGGPLALLLASAIGYLLGARALAPVDAMRARAGEITLDRAGERLPTPVADDELRSLADTLNEMLDRVEAALQRERVFVSDASHELRTPLAILKSEIELVRRTGGSKAEMEAALDSAAEEVDQLILLAEDLLVIARSEQGRLPLRREPVAVDALVERIGDRFERTAADAGRSLVIGGVGVGSWEIDRLRTEQALSNLVDNALRYGAGAIGLQAQAAGNELVLTVSDEGPGFPEAFAADAFERFTQADPSRSETSAGLGLAIVRAIAHAHDGEAVIVDRERGAEVQITLRAPPSPGSL